MVEDIDHISIMGHCNHVRSEFCITMLLIELLQTAKLPKLIYSQQVHVIDNDQHGFLTETFHDLTLG